MILERHHDSPHGAELLARSVRFEGLRRSRAIDSRRIALEFVDAATAEGFCSDVSPVFDLGPFRIGSVSAEQIRLERRGRSAIERIELLSMGTDDQWRRLLAHDIDVLPSADSVHRSQFAGISSIRVIDLPPPNQFGLYFDTRAGPFANPLARHALANLLDRDAIAQLACGSRACASRMWSALPLPPIASLPDKLSLAVLGSDYAAQLAAKTIRHQLHQRGIRVGIDLVDLEQLVARLYSGPYEMALLPMQTTLVENAMLFQSGNPRNPTGWSTPELDAAIARDDPAAVGQVLTAALPALPLYEVTLFAAVDDQFCGGAASRQSWRWLADLRPCEDEPAR